MVALHSNMLARGEGLYYDLNRYPFTVSPYGPIFYGLSALLHKMGAPLYQGARGISFAALVAALWCGWRILGLLVIDRYARIAGVLLAASTATLVFWGTSGQVDMLAFSLSLAAFLQFLRWREQRVAWLLFASGILVVLSVFTKQTALAGGVTIALCLLTEDRKRAAVWITVVAIAGASIAVALNAVTHGHYIANAIWANLNPFSAGKLLLQARYLALTSGGLILIAIAGAKQANRRTAPLYLYTLLAAGVWLATAPKIGSDLNYEIEMTLLCGLCVACALDALGFFSKVIVGDKTWVTLLQIPLALHIILNLTVTARNLAERVVLEPEKRAEIAALRPYMGPERRMVLAGPYDALVLLRGRTDVETFIYSLLVAAGRVDPGPVLRDLSARRFQTVILSLNVFSEKAPWDDPELLNLPPAHLEAIRQNYRLVKHVPGPPLEGNYIYEPRL
jgi:4-amino-4-deoxy-L-arabinose transferase-like glycosyltransferase